MMHESELLIAGCTFAFGLAFGMSFALKKGAQQSAAAPAAEAKVVANDGSLFNRPGWTMAEARELADEGQKAAFAMAPKEVLENLQRGNVRFWTGTSTRPEKSAFERRALINKQFPSTAILSCADSRVPTEIVFDQHLGDMFVVRCAGNAVTDTTMGSLQYAVNHLKVKVLMVMGHEACGAVKAAALPDDVLKNEPPALCRCLGQIKMGLDFDRLGKIQDPRSHDREAVITNVKRQVEALAKDEKIMEKVRSGELMIVGAFYEISSGIVDFFNEVKK